MSKDQKDFAKKELEKIYDNNFKLLKAGKALSSKFSRSLEENPKLNLLLKISFFSAVGIWSIFALILFQSF